WVDDLQWADRDTSALLAELCSPPQQPSVLLLLSYRSEDVPTNSTLTYLRNVLTLHDSELGSWRHLDIRGMSESESRELLSNLAGGSIDQKSVEEILREAGGHPLFLAEIARYASRHGQIASLEVALGTRISHLPRPERDLLEIVATCAQPLTQALLFSIA